MSPLDLSQPEGYMGFRVRISDDSATGSRYWIIEKRVPRKILGLRLGFRWKQIDLATSPKAAGQIVAHLVSKKITLA